MAIDSYRDPIVPIWYTDGTQKISVPRNNEQYQIVKNKITLFEIPDEYNKINTLTIGSTPLYEVKYGNIPNTNQFVVNYTLGEITFNSIYEAQTVTVPLYYSRGIMYFPASRIYDELDSNGNIISTVGDISKNLVHKGEYNPAIQYQPRNIVYYAGGSYMCIQSCTNILPSNTLYWQQLASPGLDLTYRGDYDNALPYSSKDVVSFGGSLYYCLQNNVGIDPSNATYWTIFMAKTIGTILKNPVTLSSELSNVVIGILGFNAINDQLMVFENSTYIEKDLDYTINANGLSIDKVSGTWQNGTVFNFLVLKNISQAINFNDGSLIQDGTITNTKLALAIRVGDLANSHTTDKTSVVNAINETYDKIGNLSNLNTPDKTNIVNSINSHLADIAKVIISVLAPPAPLVAAKGDGVTDDTAAIQAILTAYAGTTIYIPKTNNFYLTSDKLNVFSNTRLIIDGTIKLADGANCSMLDLGTNNYSNIIIEGFGTLDGNENNQTSPTTAATGGIIAGPTDAFYIGNGASKVIIRDIKIINQQYWPWSLARSSDILIENVYTDNCGSSANIVQSHDFEIKGCIVSNCFGDMGLVAYGGCYRGSIHHNRSFGNHDVGINIFDDQYSPGANYWIDVHDNITFNNSGIGIAVQSNNESVHHDIKIHDNISIEDNANGLYGNGFGALTPIKDCEIYNNSIINHHGIVALQVKGENIRVYGNKIKNCGQGTNQGGAIAINAPDGGKSLKIFIHDNEVIDDQENPTTKYPIYFNAGTGIYEDIIIKDNTLTTNLVTAGQVIYNPGGWAYQAYDNIGYKTESQGIATIETGSYITTINHGLAITPTNIVFSVLGNIGTAWITNRDATSFQIQSSAPAPSPTNVLWSANAYSIIQQ